MITPKIHMNGTSKKVLVEEMCEVVHRLDLAMIALSNAAPNGRDYYITENYDAARQQYRNWQAKLLEVQGQLSSWIIEVDRQ